MVARRDPHWPRRFADTIGNTELMQLNVPQNVRLVQQKTKFAGCLGEGYSKRNTTSPYNIRPSEQKLLSGDEVLVPVLRPNTFLLAAANYSPIRTYSYRQADRVEAIKTFSCIHGERSAKVFGHEKLLSSFSAKSRSPSRHP